MDRSPGPYASSSDQSAPPSYQPSSDISPSRDRFNSVTSINSSTTFPPFGTSSSASSAMASPSATGSISGSVPGSSLNVDYVSGSVTGSVPGSASASSYFSTSSASRYVPNTNEPSSVSSSYKSAAPASYHTAFSPYNSGATPHLNSVAAAASASSSFVMGNNNTFQERSAYFSGPNPTSTTTSTTSTTTAPTGPPPPYASHHLQNLHQQSLQNASHPDWTSSTNESPTLGAHSPQSDPPHPDRNRVNSISDPSSFADTPASADANSQAKQPTIRTSLLTSKLAAAAAAAASSSSPSASSGTSIPSTSSVAPGVSGDFTQSNLPGPFSKGPVSPKGTAFTGSFNNSFSNSNTSNSSFYSSTSSAFPYPNPRTTPGSIRKQSPRTTSGAGAFGTSPYQVQGLSASYGSSGRYHHHQHRLSSSLHRHNPASSGTPSANNSTQNSSVNLSQSFLPHPASTTTNVTMAVASGTSTPHSQNSFSTAQSSESDTNNSYTPSDQVGEIEDQPSADTEMEIDDDQARPAQYPVDEDVQMEAATPSQPPAEPSKQPDTDHEMSQDPNSSSSAVTAAHDANDVATSAGSSRSSRDSEMNNQDTHNSSTSSFVGEVDSSENAVSPSTSTSTHVKSSESDQKSTNEAEAETTTTDSQQNQFEHLDIANHPVPEVIIMLTALLQKIIDANDALHPHHYQTAYAHNSTHPSNQSSSTSTIPNGDITNSSKFTANVLAFHGRNIPAIGLEAYLNRILKYCPTTNEVFISLLVYFDRIAQRANSGELNNPPTEDGESRRTPSDNSATPPRSPGGTPNNNGDAQKKQLFVMDSYNIHRLIIAGVTVASKFFSDVFYKNSRYAKVGGLPIDELNHLELQFLLLTDFRLMIPLEELQRYADLLLGFWKKEQETGSGTQQPPSSEQHPNPTEQ